MLSRSDGKVNVEGGNCSKNKKIKKQSFKYVSAVKNEGKKM